ncbi:hypothetical protein KJ586_01775 [Patescibacteria group bacterium]|nr:hypothetical protein [Patescibacteria group bacterium]MBU4455222.1 hypothetical protein [Patescibacteria group bacterium]MCG2690929.1 hypothetical protein [Candidatus Parcubacteria bacterium]
MHNIKITENNNEQLKQKANAFLIKYFNLLAIALAAIILIVGFFLLIKPKYNKIFQEIRLSNESSESKYNAVFAHLAQLNKLKAEYEKISPEGIKKIEIMLPSEKFYEEQFVQLESIVLKNGLLLTSLQISPEELPSGKESAAAKAKNSQPEKNKAAEAGLPEEVTKIKIAMNVAGVDYLGLKNLLYVLENNLQLIDITNLSFSPDQKSAALEMYAYYFVSGANNESDMNVLNTGIFDNPKFQALKESGAGGGTGAVGKRNPFEPSDKEKSNEKK